MKDKAELKWDAESIQLQRLKRDKYSSTKMKVQWLDDAFEFAMACKKGKWAKKK